MTALGRVGIWAGTFDALPVATVRSAAAAAEDLGYGALWLHETTGREAMAQAGIVLSATRRIVVATAADLYARDAVTAGAAAATLDEAFPGRHLLGLWESHPSIAEEIRGHHFGEPAPTMRAYLDALDAAPAGPPRRVVLALEDEMLALAAERSDGAHVLGMPVDHTRHARALLGPGPRLTVTQFCVPGPDGAEAARATARAALPNRRALLRELGYADVDSPGDDLVDALVAHGSVDAIARRVHEHLDAGADHVALHLATTLPLIPQWQALAAHLPVG